MIAHFTPPDPTILEDTHYTLLAVTPLHTVEVVSAKRVVAVVAMIPLPMTVAEAAEPDTATKYRFREFVVEKPGLDISAMAGRVEDAGFEDGSADDN